MKVSIASARCFRPRPRAFDRPWISGLPWVVLCLALWWLSTSPGVARAEGVEVGPEGVSVVGAAGARAVLDVDQPLAAYGRLLDEGVSAPPLDLQAAQARLAAGDFAPATATVPNGGNGAPPRWLHLSIDNPGTEPLDYRVYATEAWVDRVDVWLVADGHTLRHWQGGDERAPGRDLRAGIGFGFDAQLPVGRSEIFMRADSIDSAAMLLRLVPLERAAALEASTGHWIGLVHGFLLALVATYGLLWFALRERNHLRYVAYVGSYLLMHLAYSGIASQLVWPETPAVARYSILVGMTLFSSAGLWFARGFLTLSAHAPVVDRVVAWVSRGAPVVMGLLVAANLQLVAVHFAFGYIMLFTFAMVGLGLLALRHAREQARPFLVATVLSMCGALVTTLAVMGTMPFSPLTFRAVEVGVMLEASIWALALGLRLRRQQHDGARALALAHRDPLTGLNNRRGFVDQALPVWSTAARKFRPLSAILLDIDHFKHINDRHGHAAGDRVLVEVADRLSAACRAGDIVARWGGEEFVMLLPETRGEQACALAERLREVFAQAPVPLGDGRSAAFTASFGVAVRAGAMSLEELLRAADSALYAAKDAGRDRVVVASAPPSTH